MGIALEREFFPGIGGLSMGKKYGILLKLSALLIPIGMYISFVVLILEAVKEDLTVLTPPHWFAAVFFIFLVFNLIHIFLVIKPFVSALTIDAPLRPQYRFEHAHNLLSCSLISKFAVFPLLFIIILGFWGIGKAVSIIALAFMNPWLFLVGYLLMSMAPSVIVISWVIVISIIWLTSIYIVPALTQLALSRRENVLSCLPGLVFMFVPFTDVLYLILMKIHKKNPRFKISTLNKICTVSSFISVIALVFIINRSYDTLSIPDASYL